MDGSPCSQPCVCVVRLAIRTWFAVMVAFVWGVKHAVCIFMVVFMCLHVFSWWAVQVNMAL